MAEAPRQPVSEMDNEMIAEVVKSLDEAIDELLMTEHCSRAALDAFEVNLKMVNMTVGLIDVAKRSRVFSNAEDISYQVESLRAHVTNLKTDQELAIQVYEKAITDRRELKEQVSQQEVKVEDLAYTLHDLNNAVPDMMSAVSLLEQKLVIFKTKLEQCLQLRLVVRVDGPEEEVDISEIEISLREAMKEEDPPAEHKEPEGTDEEPEVLGAEVQDTQAPEAKPVKQSKSFSKCAFS